MEKIHNQFVLNALKYVNVCDICNEVCMNDKMAIVQMVYFDNVHIRNICHECMKKLRMVKNIV